MSYLFACILVTAAVTYILRVLPLLLLREPIKSRWVQSFLFYVPWAVLTAMTIPAIFYATSSWISATAGLLVALFLAYRHYNLLVVALGAAATSCLLELTQSFF